HGWVVVETVVGIDTPVDEVGLISGHGQRYGEPEFECQCQHQGDVEGGAHRHRGLPGEGLHGRDYKSCRLIRRAAGAARSAEVRCYSSASRTSRRLRTASARRSSILTLSSQPMQASVMETPYASGLPGTKSCRPGCRCDSAITPT